MARMIGKTLRILQCPYECCGDMRDKHAAKIREKADALHFEEIASTDRHDHDNGICYNPPGGYGCKYCYGEDLDDAYDNSDLDDIPGVWCSVDWREDPDIKRYLQEEEIWATRLSQSHRTEADGA